MKKQSGVNKKLFKSYNFEDHIWYKNSPEFDHYLKLADRCIIVGKNYWMRNTLTNVWAEIGVQGQALNEAYSKWLGGEVIERPITKDLIKAFFTGDEKRSFEKDGKTIEYSEKIGSCPRIDGCTVLPLCTQMVQYKGKLQLNIWKDESIQSDEKHILLGRTLLRIVYRSLCNGEQLHQDPANEAELILQQVLTDSYTNIDFKVVMYFLATLVQRPGYNLLINLWFCGELEGIGKGTLMDIMKVIIGSNLFTTLNKSDVERGWTHHLMGRTLIEVNELDVHGKNCKMTGQEWGVWIKEKCNETSVTFSQRGVDTDPVINIGNYIFTTNDENPVFLSKTDRRNQMIKTTDDPYWVAYASEFQSQHVQRDINEVAAGFAHILEQVKIDFKFISKAHINEFKAGIQESSSNEVEEWIKTDITIQRDKFCYSAELFEEFKTWCHSARPGKPVITLQSFGRMMGKCSKLGVEKKTTNSGAQYWIGNKIESIVIDREEVAKQMGKDTNTPVVFENHDIVQEKVILDIDNFTPLQKLRAKLLMQKDDYFDSEK